ncbi:hypothetical protein [Bartonella sp. AP36NXGY]
MKRRHEATTEFRVPLSSEALKILTQARLLSCHDFFRLTVMVPLVQKLLPTQEFSVTI